MSQKLQRYLSVQRAKGQQADPLTLARMLREDVAQPTDTGISTPATPGVAAESIAKRRRQLISAPRALTSSDVSSDPTPAPDLSSMIGAELGMSTALGFVGKGLAKGTVAKAVTGLPMAKALPLGFSPLSVAVTMGKLGFSSVQAGIIGQSVESAFGLEAAQEAASVMSGRVSLASVSPKAQAAYANAKVAAQYASQNPLNFSKPNITSLVTPFHTNEAISAAFGVDSGSTSGTPGGVTSGRGQPGGQSVGLVGGEGSGGSGGNAGGTGPGGPGPGGYGGGGLR